MSQGLVRNICNYCKEEYKPNPALLYNFFGTRSVEKPLFRGRGCPNCHNTGFSGRIAISELIIIDNTLAEMIQHEASNTEILGYAIKKGMITMHQDSKKKVLEGLTTIEEVMKVIELDQNVNERFDSNSTSDTIIITRF